jgi:hypothetical protein
MAGSRPSNGTLGLDADAVTAEDPLDALVIWVRRSVADLDDILSGKFQLSFPDLDVTGRVAEASIDAMGEQILQLQMELPRLR